MDTILTELGTATEQLKQLKKDVSKAKQHLQKVEKEYADTQKVVNELSQHIPAIYYPHLEATKVIQVILDQPGMFKVGRLVCKKWNGYLVSKARPNLILSVLIRGMVESKNDPYPLFSKEVFTRTTFYQESMYYAIQLKSNGDKRDQEEIRNEYKKMPISKRKTQWKQQYKTALREFNKQKELYLKFSRRDIPKLGFANKIFYNFLITNMLDHPIGPPLNELYNHCQDLFAEPIGSMWHITEHVLPFVKDTRLDIFYGKLQCYIPITDMFPGYQPKPATPGPASPGPKKAYPKKALKKAVAKRAPRYSDDSRSDSDECVCSSISSGSSSDSDDQLESVD